MKKGDIAILIIGMLLLAAMLLTLFFGGQTSRHGVGSLLKRGLPGKEIACTGGQGLIIVAGFRSRQRHGPVRCVPG